MTTPASQQPQRECPYSRTLEEVGDFCIIKDDWVSELQCGKCPARPHTPAPDDNELEDLGNQDIDPKVFAAWGDACERGAQEQFLREHDAAIARTATLAETQRIYGLFHEVERLHLNGMAYPDLYNEMVTRIKFIHTEPLSKDGRKKK
jgi:hypothetical protein